MNIFAELPWQMREEDGPSDYRFIVEGMEWFDRVKRIIEAPYDELVKAHNAAMQALEH